LNVKYFICASTDNDVLPHIFLVQNYNDYKHICLPYENNKHKYDSFISLMYKYPTIKLAIGEN